MTSWKKYRLGDITIMRNGKKRPNTQGIYPVYGGNGIMDYTDCYNAENTIIVGRVGAYCGNVYQSKGKCWVSDNAISVSATELVDSSFLYYLMSSIDFHYHHIGGAQPLMTQDIIGGFEISLPGLEGQRRIAGILGAIDDKIENNRRINTNLELQAQALYKQWFVDNRNDDWEKKKLESIIDIGSGKGLARIDFVEDGLYPILGANGQIGRTNNFLIDKKDNVLFTGRVGTLGNVFRLQQKRAWLSDNTLIITPKKKYYNYVYFFLKSSNLKDFNVGSTQPLIRQSDIKEMDILIPDYLTLEAFENKCIAMFDKINQANAEIDFLATLRDTLLPKLMNGEIKV